MPKKTTKKTTKKYTYICPACSEKQDTVISWQTESVAYEFNLKSGESEEVDKSFGDHEAFVCPGCGEDLPIDLGHKITTILDWY